MDFTGLSLANYVDEPEKKVTEFLQQYPSSEQISELLTLYKAYVIELALKAHDLRVNERQWQTEIPSNVKDMARFKFNLLNNRPSEIQSILDAYRGATVRLIRSLRRQLDQIGSPISPSHHHQPAGKAGSSLFDVGRIVSSGLEMIFGEPSLSDTTHKVKTALCTIYAHITSRSYKISYSSSKYN